VKKEEPEEEERKKLLPGLEEETRPWWVEYRELQAALSRHPDDPQYASSETLVVVHSLAAAKPVLMRNDAVEVLAAGARRRPTSI
jgi:hypothetical protein